MNDINLTSIDYKNFAKELDELRKKIDNELGEEDFKHLRKIELWGKLCSLFGYLTSWIIINPVSAFLISQGNVTRWAMMTHHISHKGYDKIKAPKKYNSKYYAKGIRRFLDWPEWMHPEAWNIEHNILHHYHTGELTDPDFAQNNVQVIRNANLPLFLKYIIIFFFITNWKLTYYAPNTFWLLRQKKKHKGKLKDFHLDYVKTNKVYPGAKIFLPITKDGILFWLNCVIPYISYRFILIPSLFLPFGSTYFLTVLINSILAEIITNIHSFMIIVPNHTGDDLACFEGNVRNKSEFYVRQVSGSVNYKCGNDLNDFFHGWLNYQIEHHIWPDLPMFKYQKYQSKVEEICKKYNVPYVKQSVFKRFIKTLNILVGKETMVKVKTLNLEKTIKQI